MFDHTKKLLLAGGVSLIALTGAAHAEDMPSVSEIDVSTSYEAAEDTNAQAVFPEISDDLRAEIAKRIPTSSDAGDPRIDVEVRKIALNGNMMIPETGEFNQLEGVVYIASDDADVDSRSFPVRISALPGEQTAPEGVTLIQPTTGDYYTVMISAFADRVAEELAKANTAGNSVNR